MACTCKGLQDERWGHEASTLCACLQVTQHVTQPGRNLIDLGVAVRRASRHPVASETHTVVEAEQTLDTPSAHACDIPHAQDPWMGSQRTSGKDQMRAL